MGTTSPPGADEYAPAFAGYVARIAGREDILAVLSQQLDQALTTFDSIPEPRGDYRYAPGKWSIKQVVGHLSDTERVFAYRALRIGRADTTPLPGFDDQAYVAEQRADEQALVDLAVEWGAVRRATLALYRSLSPGAWARRGVAGNEPITVRALAYVIAGHVRHHLEVLDTRYTG